MLVMSRCSNVRGEAFVVRRSWGVLVIRRDKARGVGGDNARMDWQARGGIRQMASLKSAVTWARLHVASDEREERGRRGRKEKHVGAERLQLRCSGNFDLALLLMFNTLHLFTGGLHMRQRLEMRCRNYGMPFLMPHACTRVYRRVVS